MNFAGKMKGLLLNPSKTFDACKEETLDEAMRYYLGFTAIVSAVVALFFVIYFNKVDSLLGFETGFGNLGEAERIALSGVIWTVVFFFSILVVWIVGAIIHIGVYFLGGRKGINQTIKAFIYSLYVLGLLVLIDEFLLQIPYVNKRPDVVDSLEIIVPVWFFILIILGVRQLQGITTLRAILGVLFIPLVLILALILASVIYAFLFGTFP